MAAKLFVMDHQLVPVPATSDTLGCYAAFLARKLKYSSIRQYLNIIKILHLEWNLPDPPFFGNFTLHTTLRGIRHQLGASVSSKAPVTLAMLLHFISKLDLTNPSHVCMCAASLLLFFSLPRKSNVLPVITS